MNNDIFATVYFKNDYEPDANDLDYFEDCLKIEIGMGDGYVNLYTNNKQIVRDFVDLIGDFYIDEVSMDDLK